MKRTIWLIVFGVVVFGGIVIARLPASWIAPGPNSPVTCSDVDGTIWSGTCLGLTSQRQVIGDVSWQLHPLRLLAGKLNADLVLTRPTGDSHGTVEIGLNKNMTARNIQADLPLDRALMPQLPPGLHGNVHAEIASLRLERNIIRAVEGRIEARDLVDGTGNAAEPWGSYSVTFPPATGGDPIGQIQDLGGPLAVEGALRLTPEPGFSVEGLVKARPTAPAGLAQEIQFLGSPDAQGRRPFSLAATF